MVDVQPFVAAMCESVAVMKLSESKKEFAKAVLRSAIEYANAKHGMHASQGARSAVTIQASARMMESK